MRRPKSQSKKLEYESVECATDSIEINEVAQNEQSVQTEDEGCIAAMFHTNRSDTRPHVTVTILDRRVNALVDTGAQVTAIGHNWIRNINDWGDELLPYNGTLRMADSTIQRPIGQIDITYRFNDESHTITTIVLSRPTKSLILGMDFLTAFHIGVTDVAANIAKIEFIGSIEQPENNTDVHPTTNDDREPNTNAIDERPATQ